jgi:O-antigen ligase
MVLVVLSEERPYDAIAVVLKRLAFLWLPLSVLFIKFYPDLGRTYHHDGTPMYTGVGHQKNDLGLICLMSGIYLAWKLLPKRKTRLRSSLVSIGIDLVIMAMMVWLFSKSDSKTSLVCLLLIVALLLAHRISYITKRPSRLVMVSVVALSLASLLEIAFDVSEQIYAMLGRDSSLTSRTSIWQSVQKYAGDSLLGAGYQSFWAGPRLAAITRDLGAGLNQAHNGYLEQYLNLGYFGLSFTVVIMLTSLIKVRKQLDIAPSAALLRLCLIAGAALYNYAEASFYGINNMWLLLLLACIGNVPRTGRTMQVQHQKRWTRETGVAPDSRHVVDL